MKKIVLLVLVCLVTIYSNGQSKLTQINIKPKGCNWGEWTRCQPNPIDVEFNKLENLITIKSYTQQVINYSSLDSVRYINYYELSGIGSDDRFQRVKIIRRFYDDGVSILWLKYGDGEFAYMVK